MLLNHMTFESSRSRFPFSTKLCFSKWSEIRQNSSSSSGRLQFRTMSRAPWFHHSCEYVMSATAEFPVSQMTPVLTNGESTWTLWHMTDQKTKAVEPPTATGNATVEPIESGSDSLLNVIQNQLCFNRDEQGDVLLDPNVGLDAVDIVQTAQGGPLGDA
ncbi:uncharacterized protein LOC112681015 [Sipha flava]|uniref:Uncharacterized protein LOC112681015 n=1 Tax=Sipha flava TaxID=143950 RepID=A0A8B8F8A8_9HEMI|nr:uncharacterized protein LOC112681015 [Sipha flava]